MIVANHRDQVVDRPGGRWCGGGEALHQAAAQDEVGEGEGESAPRQAQRQPLTTGELRQVDEDRAVGQHDLLDVEAESAGIGATGQLSGDRVAHVVGDDDAALDAEAGKDLLDDVGLGEQ